MKAGERGSVRGNLVITGLLDGSRKTWGGLKRARSQRSNGVEKASGK